jgi:hypothetical protein
MQSVAAVYDRRGENQAVASERVAIDLRATVGCRLEFRAWKVYLSRMTARQIIQEIKSLSSEEQLEIKTFLLHGEQGVVRYADREKALAVADKIFTERAELFQKLAQ